jgi:hypothetical protein
MILILSAEIGDPPKDVPIIWSMIMSRDFMGHCVWELESRPVCAE